MKVTVGTVTGLICFGILKLGGVGNGLSITGDVDEIVLVTDLVIPGVDVTRVPVLEVVEVVEIVIVEVVEVVIAAC